MIVLPLFWDQYDNAQRVQELGFGRRLDTYGATQEDIVTVVDQLLADTDLRVRMAAISQGLRAAPAQERAADVVERLANAT
jgi:UDP:flavonoid glycosyltransferase YjiC (YdhE family)